MLEAHTVRALIARSAAPGRVVSTRDHVLPLDAFVAASPFGADRRALAGRSVVLSVRDMAKAAAAIIDLDGLARRVLLCPPGWDAAKLAAAAVAAGADAFACDGEVAAPALEINLRQPVSLPLRACEIGEPAMETEWLLPSSGTSGPPKLAVHTLATLTSAIDAAPGQEWATFYDIRRYGGLQIFLRALAGTGSLRLTGVDEDVGGFLKRLTDAGATHVSGTPTHWRMALLAGAGSLIDPVYVRLSGEIADDALLTRLGAAFPRARIEHAYASTEAGVVFGVDDLRAGFPAAWLGADGPVSMKIKDGSLRVRSPGRARRLLGDNAPALLDEQGFIDTDDMIEIRDGRCYFVGRGAGVINVGGDKVHPEEVEAVLNSFPLVRASRAFARPNRISGSLVAAEVVLNDPAAAREGLDREIISAALKKLPPSKAPVQIRFVTELPMTAAGKLRRLG
jgi:acyl-coenzyme A synthetase/AMP-(fatty) acid ligase